MRWAALPAVYELTEHSAPTFLSSGASAIAFVKTGRANKTIEYYERRLRRVSESLVSSGRHGLWLLWAERDDPAHSRLRAQLGLSATGDAADDDGAAEFAIVSMGGARILNSYVMSAQLSPISMLAFCEAYLRGTLAREAWLGGTARQATRGAVGLAACALVGAGFVRWRRRARRRSLDRPPASTAVGGGADGASQRPAAPKRGRGRGWAAGAVIVAAVGAALALSPAPSCDDFFGRLDEDRRRGGGEQAGVRAGGRGLSGARDRLACRRHEVGLPVGTLALGPTIVRDAHGGVVAIALPAGIELILW